MERIFQTLYERGRQIMTHPIVNLLTALHAAIRAADEAEIQRLRTLIDHATRHPP